MNNRRITLLRPSQVFNSFMDEFFNSPSLGWGNSGSSVQVDMYEDDNNVFVEVNAPGYKQNEIEIKVEGDVLTISGKTENQKEEGKEGRKYYVKEITKEEFHRSFTLPSSVDSASADAEMKDGMLLIKMPKKPEVKPQMIQIKG